MGKTTCEACSKRCKGHAIKLSDTRYVHLKCFTCKECKKPLSANAFFVQNKDRYCTQDYQRLFGTKCQACDKYVEGQVVTVLGKSYHQDCIVCTKCRKNIGAGSKLTVLEKEFWCQQCATEADRVRLSKLNSPDGHLKDSITKDGTKVPPVDSNSERPQEISIRQNQLSSTDSAFAGDMTDGGGEEEHAVTSPQLMSPTSGTSGYKSDDITSDQDVNHNIKVSSTPHDQRSSTCSSDSPHSSRKLKDESEVQRLNFGKFYQTSFLDKGSTFKRGPSINPQEKTPQHFHRPHGFSYRRVRSDIAKPNKTGMLNCLAGNTMGSLSLPRNFDQRYKPDDKQEPIQLAKIPDAKKSEHYQRPIERDDFIARPEPAAIYPELLRDPRLREKFLRGDTVDGQSENKENDPEIPANPKIEKEINELSKITNSGTAQMILEDLKKKKKLDPLKLDPRNSSRSRSAAVEPPQKTRFESPVFASPSRDLLKARLFQYDDMYEQKYRTCTSPTAARPGYGIKSRTLDSRMGCMSAMAFRSNTVDPGLGRNSSVACRSATLGARNGYVSDTTDGYYPSNIMSYHRRPESSTAVLQRSCTPLSDTEEYDQTTGLKVTPRNYLHRLNVILDGRRTPTARSSSLRRNLQGIFAEEEQTKIYPYEQLSLDSTERPTGLDSNNLEQYLADDDFQRLFGMSREDFETLAEWKRNDLKLRVRLFESTVEKAPTPCPT